MRPPRTAGPGPGPPAVHKERQTARVQPGDDGTVSSLSETVPVCNGPPNGSVFRIYHRIKLLVYSSTGKSLNY